MNYKNLFNNKINIYNNMSNAKTFRIKGKFTKKGREQIFSKEISALNEKLAWDKVYSLIGSNHKVKRNHIKILEVNEVKKEELSND